MRRRIYTGLTRGRDLPTSNNRFTLQRIRLNNSGYDRSGAYWGFGKRLYWACSDDCTIERFFRAKDRVDAKKILRQEFPKATFYR